MPILNPTESFEKIHIPANFYPATLISCREIEIDDREAAPGTKKKVLAWAFEIVGSTKTVTVEGLTSYTFSAKSKAGIWARALMGGGEPTGPLDTDDLIGNACRVRVEDREKNGEKYSGVADVKTAGSTDTF